MNNKTALPLIRNSLALGAILFSWCVSLAQANPLGGQIPQIPAFLPWSSDVPVTEKLPIDGEWMISSNRKRIRIEGGRAYAVDPWVHLFVLKIEPLMVVSKEWRRTDTGRYAGQDLPLMGQFTAMLATNGNLNVKVAGMFGPVSFSLIPTRIDDQAQFDREKSGRDPKPSPEDDYDDEEYADEEGYAEDEDDYSEDESSYEDDEESYEDEDGYEDGEEYSDEDYDDEDYEEEAPSKVAAFKLGKAKKGCAGKQIYLSGGSCYSCPTNYRRFSPTRKMTHPKACTQRGIGTKKVKARYKWQANGCPKRQFKHKGYCKACPEGTKRMHVAGLDSGYCKVLN